MATPIAIRSPSAVGVMPARWLAPAAHTFCDSTLQTASGAGGGAALLATADAGGAVSPPPPVSFLQARRATPITMQEARMVRSERIGEGRYRAHTGPSMVP